MAAKVKALQQWCKRLLEGYRDVSIVNMTTSWKDGLAFCAIIHKYRPDMIDFHSLSKENILHNNQLAFDIAESLGIPALLDAEDMVAVRVPDKLSVITYVSQMYNYFHDKVPAGGPTVRKFHGKTPAHGMKRAQIDDPPTPAPEVKRSAGRVQPPQHSAQEPSTVTRRNQSSQRASNVTRGSMGDTCQICDGKVYLMERHIDNGKLYHRSCFRDKEKSMFKSSTRSSSSVSPSWSPRSLSPKSPGMSVFHDETNQVSGPAVAQAAVFQKTKTNEPRQVGRNQNQKDQKVIMGELLTNLNNVRKQHQQGVSSPTQQQERVTSPSWRQQKPTSPVHQPQKVKSPVQEQERLKTPPWRQQRATSPTSEQERVTSPSWKNQLRKTSPIQEQEKVTTPSLKQQHKMTSPTREQERVASPSWRQQQRTTSPTQEQEKVTTPSWRQQQRTTSPTQEQEKVTTPSWQQQQRMISPTREQKRVASPSCRQQQRTTSPTSEPVRAVSPMQQQERVTSPSLIQQRFKASTQEQERVTPSWKQQRAVSPAKEQQRVVSPTFEQDRATSPPSKQQNLASPTPQRQRIASPSREQGSRDKSQSEESLSSTRKTYKDIWRSRFETQKEPPATAKSAGKVPRKEISGENDTEKKASWQVIAEEKRKSWGDQEEAVSLPPHEAEKSSPQTKNGWQKTERSSPQIDHSGNKNIIPNDQSKTRTAQQRALSPLSHKNITNSDPQQSMQKVSSPQPNRHKVNTPAKEDMPISQRSWSPGGSEVKGQNQRVSSPREQTYNQKQSISHVQKKTQHQPSSPSSALSNTMRGGAQNGGAPHTQVRKPAAQRATANDNADVPTWKIEAQRRQAARGGQYVDPEFNKATSDTKSPVSNHVTAHQNSPSDQQVVKGRHDQINTSTPNKSHQPKSVDRLYQRTTEAESRENIRSYEDNSPSGVLSQNRSNQPSSTVSKSKEVYVKPAVNQSRDVSKTSSNAQKVQQPANIPASSHTSQTPKSEARNKFFQTDEGEKKPSWQEEVEKRRKKWEHLYTERTDEEITSISKTQPQDEAGDSKTRGLSNEMVQKPSSTAYSNKPKSQDNISSLRLDRSRHASEVPVETQKSDHSSFNNRFASDVSGHNSVTQTVNSGTDEEMKISTQNTKTPDIIESENPESDQAENEKPTWQIEAQKRVAARKGTYADPEFTRTPGGQETKQESQEEVAGISDSTINSSTESGDTEMKDVVRNLENTDTLGSASVDHSNREAKESNKEEKVTKTPKRKNTNILDELFIPVTPAKTTYNERNLQLNGQTSDKIISQISESPRSILKNSTESNSVPEIEAMEIEETDENKNTSNNHRVTPVSPTLTSFIKDSGDTAFPPSDIALMVVPIDSDQASEDIDSILNSIAESNAEFINDSSESLDLTQFENEMKSTRRIDIINDSYFTKETKTDTQSLSEIVPTETNLTTNNTTEKSQTDHLNSGHVLRGEKELKGSDKMSDFLDKNNDKATVSSKDAEREDVFSSSIDSHKISQTNVKKEPLYATISKPAADSTKQNGFANGECDKPDVGEVPTLNKGSVEAKTKEDNISKENHVDTDKYNIDSISETSEDAVISSTELVKGEIQTAKESENGDDSITDVSDVVAELSSSSDNSDYDSIFPEAKFHPQMAKTRKFPSKIKESEENAAALSDGQVTEESRSSTLPRQVHKSRSFDYLERLRSRQRYDSSGAASTDTDTSTSKPDARKMRSVKSCDELDNYDWQTKAEQRHKARKEQFGSPERTLINTIITVKNSLDKFAVEKDENGKDKPHTPVSPKTSTNPFENNGHDSGVVSSFSSTPNGHLRKIIPNSTITFDDNSDGISDTELASPPPADEPKTELATLPTSIEVVDAPAKPKVSTKKRRPAPLPPASIRKINAEERVPIFTILDELESLDQELREMEQKGRELEQTIREATDGQDEDDALMIDWFQLINQKNELVRRETLLMYRQRQQELEDEHAAVEYELRVLIEKPEHLRVPEDKDKEEQLIERMLDIVTQRNAVVDNIDEDRLRYLEEDQDIAEMMAVKGFLRGHDPDGDFKEICLDDFEPQQGGASFAKDSKSSTAKSKAESSKTNTKTLSLTEKGKKDGKDKKRKDKKKREKEEKERIREETKKLKELEKNKKKRMKEVAQNSKMIQT